MILLIWYYNTSCCCCWTVRMWLENEWGWRESARCMSHSELKAQVDHVTVGVCEVRLLTTFTLLLCYFGTLYYYIRSTVVILLLKISPSLQSTNIWYHTAMATYPLQKAKSHHHIRDRSNPLVSPYACPPALCGGLAAVLCTKSRPWLCLWWCPCVGLRPAPRRQSRPWSFSRWLGPTCWLLLTSASVSTLRSSCRWA